MRAAINEYKYNSAMALSNVFAEMIISVIGEGYNIVPLPTISEHIRKRGFDHISLISKKIARISNNKYDPVLGRKNHTVQVGTSSEKRKKQASEAYEIVGKINPDVNYLLLDDVWTSGSSMLAAYEKIFQAGARKISIAVIAKTV